jgi:hypothetical protein
MAPIGMRFFPQIKQMAQIFLDAGGGLAAAIRGVHRRFAS